MTAFEMLMGQLYELVVIRGESCFDHQLKLVTDHLSMFYCVSIQRTKTQGSVLGCPKPVLGRTVPKTRFKPAFYCPKLSKTAQNRPKLSKTAN